MSVSKTVYVVGSFEQKYYIAYLFELHVQVQHIDERVKQA